MSRALAPASPPRSYLAFDFGTRRVGVATGNAITGTATPLTTVDAKGEARADAIAALVGAWRPDALVVGVPYHPDGAPHANTTRARRFARELGHRFGLPVHEVDERYTTTDARRAGTGDVDAVAAAILLEQHLAGLP
ncbi:MAG TPA: Holliday junction resolvase RuvX [Caldimonas sp.]|jgi:putative Holliday junction resolvase